jgi:hexulose-6-phosphate isomerase
MSEGSSLDDRFARLVGAGFDGVDVIAPDDVPVAELLAASERTGLAIANVLAGRSRESTLADPDPSVRSFAVEGLELGLRAAAELGASSLMMPTLAPEGIEPARASEATLRELEPVLAVAAEVGVRLAFENCWNGFLLSAESLAAFVDALDSPWAAVHFDVGNVSPIGLPEDWIPVLNKRIHKIDLKDFDQDRARAGGIPHGQELELGDGDCNWSAVVGALRQVGFAGWVSAEVPGTGDALLARTSSAIDRLFEEG